MPAERPFASLHFESPKDDRGADHAKQLLGDLQELIAALDRRVPRLERIGELAIARDAADLRERAVRLIREIEETTPKA